MTERPIRFSGPMVRAILEGRKTQTRRVVNCRDGLDALAMHQYGRCPYGVPGDRLWVRETWRSFGERGRGGEIERFMYRAGVDAATDGWKWKPDIHMPRRACRLVLEVTIVRVERLQEISEIDAECEGSLGPSSVPVPSGQHRSAYRALWDSLNAKRAPWALNPWVWVVEFKRDDGDRAR